MAMLWLSTLCEVAWRSVSQLQSSDCCFKRADTQCWQVSAGCQTDSCILTMWVFPWCCWNSLTILQQDSSRAGVLKDNNVLGSSPTGNKPLQQYPFDHTSHLSSVWEQTRRGLEHPEVKVIADHLWRWWPTLEITYCIMLKNIPWQVSGTTDYKLNLWDVWGCPSPSLWARWGSGNSLFSSGHPWSPIASDIGVLTGQDKICWGWEGTWRNCSLLVTPCLILTRMLFSSF